MSAGGMCKYVIRSKGSHTSKVLITRFSLHDSHYMILITRFSLHESHYMSITVLTDHALQIVTIAMSWLALETTCNTQTNCITLHGFRIYENHRAQAKTLFKAHVYVTHVTIAASRDWGNPSPACGH
jgi:hypothetical protein